MKPNRSKKINLSFQFTSMLVILAFLLSNTAFAVENTEISSNNFSTQAQNAVRAYKDVSKDKGALVQALFEIEQNVASDMQKQITANPKIHAGIKEALLKIIADRLIEFANLREELKNIIEIKVSTKVKTEMLSAFLKKAKEARSKFVEAFKAKMAEALITEGESTIKTFEDSLAAIESKITELKQHGVDTKQLEQQATSIKVKIEKADKLLHNKNFKGARVEFGKINADVKKLADAVNAAATSIPPVVIPANVPEEYRDLYVKLEGKLGSFEDKIDSSWDGVKYPVAFSAQLWPANSNNGEALITPQNYALTLVYLNRLQDLGVKGITIELNFPLLTPGFLDEPKRLQYLDFYKKVADEVKKRGLVLSIESQAIFSDFSSLPVKPYYEGLTFDEYKQGRLETFKVIAAELRPDYLTIANEPDTEAANTGQTALKDVNTYVATINFYIDGLKKTGITLGKLGGGFGTWQKDYKNWATKFSTKTDLDFINIHIYPIDSDFLDRALTISDIAKQNGKGVAEHEAWPYKWQIGETSGDIAASAQVYSRDTFSFWQPLDQKFIEVLVKLAHYKKFEYISPFWSNYFFAYLEYEDVKDIPAQQLLNMGIKAGVAKAREGKTTETGLFYQQLIQIPTPTPTPTPAPTTTPSGTPTPLPTPTPTPVSAAPSAIDFLNTDGNLILDSSGRPVILRGFVTITHFDIGKNEVVLTSDDYRRMRALGLNYQSIRIFVGWIGGYPGFEPAPGYLQKLDDMVSLAKQNGIYSEFKLTMYDLPGMLDFTSSQREETWGDFWQNRNGEQEKLVEAWKRIWEHYKDEPAIFGYDVLNEAEIGTLGVSPEVFMQDFLTPFYRKVIDEFKKIDTKHLVLIQSGFGGVNPRTGDITFYPSNIPIGRSGTVYAPHFYINLVKPRDGVFFPDRYQALLDRYVREAKTHDAPLFLGEMGEFWFKENDGNATKESAFRLAEDQQIDLFDQAMLGFSRPVYANDNSLAKGHNILKGTSRSLAISDDRTIITDIMSRPYPQRTAGVLSQFSFDIGTKRFAMTYRPASALGTTEIFIPRQRHYSGGFTFRHSSGITLTYDQASSSLRVSSNEGRLDVNRFSWDETNQVLRIAEWEGGGQTITITIDQQ